MMPRPRRVWPEPVPHGGPDYRELARLGLRAEDLLDFSVNSNPLGASPLALRALREVDPSRYPDSRSLLLRDALAARLGVTPDEVIVGSGSVELIWLLAQVYLAAGDRVFVVGPTFGEYAAAAESVGAQVVTYRSDADDDFQPRLDQLIEVLRTCRPRPRLLFICNPNNPTGQVQREDEISALAKTCVEGLVVVDEAYVDFLDTPRDGEPDVTSMLDEAARGPRAEQRIVVLRSLTKSYGLAGLRLGYAVAAPEVVTALGRAQLPWSVNSLAQAAGLAALEDQEHLEAGRRAAAESKVYLLRELRRLGFSSVASRTSFSLVKVGDGAGLRRSLLERGILVRDCASFGVPEYVRIAARPMAECEQLISALSAIVSNQRQGLR